MPGDIRCEEFGPFPYHYENRFDHHPAADSINLGTAEEWEKNKSSDQVARVIQNMRQKYLDTDLDII